MLVALILEDSPYNNTRFPSRTTGFAQKPVYCALHAFHSTGATAQRLRQCQSGDLSFDLIGHAAR